MRFHRLRFCHCYSPSSSSSLLDGVLRKSGRLFGMSLPWSLKSMRKLARQYSSWLSMPSRSWSARVQILEKRKKGKCF